MQAHLSDRSVKSHPEHQDHCVQIQDAANHLQEALRIVGSRQKNYKFKSALEVLNVSAA
jgi:hypothetical protein